MTNRTVGWRQSTGVHSRSVERPTTVLPCHDRKHLLLGVARVDQDSKSTTARLRRFGPSVTSRSPPGAIRSARPVLRGFKPARWTASIAACGPSRCPGMAQSAKACGRRSKILDLPCRPQAERSFRCDTAKTVSRLSTDPNVLPSIANPASSQPVGSRHAWLLPTLLLSTSERSGCRRARAVDGANNSVDEPRRAVSIAPHQ